MDLSAIYSKTPKGLRARASLIGGLSSHLMKVLTHVDGAARAENILLKFEKLTPQQLTVDLSKLEQEGYIRLATVTSDNVTSDNDNGWALTVNFEPMVVEEFQSEEALEISTEKKVAEQQAKIAQVNQLNAELAAQQLEATCVIAQQKINKKAQKFREKEKTKAEVKVKAQLEMESRQQQQALQDKLRFATEVAAEAARQNAEIARIKVEAEAQFKAQQQALKIAEQQAAERAAKLAEEDQRKAESKAREAAEHAKDAAEAKAKESARIQIQRISREAEVAQQPYVYQTEAN